MIDIIKAYWWMWLLAGLVAGSWLVFSGRENSRAQREIETRKIERLENAVREAKTRLGVLEEIALDIEYAAPRETADLCEDMFKEIEIIKADLAGL